MIATASDTSINIVDLLVPAAIVLSGLLTAGGALIFFVINRLDQLVAASTRSTRELVLWTNQRVATLSDRVASRYPLREPWEDDDQPTLWEFLDDE